MKKLKRDKDRINIESVNKTEDTFKGGYIIIIDKGNTNVENRKTSRFGFDMSAEALYTSTNIFWSKYDYNGKLLENLPYGPPFHDKKFLESYFIFEYPAQDKINVTQQKYIQDYIHDFATPLSKNDFTKGDNTYHKYVHIATFVDYFLINELYFNIDAYRLSFYLTKDKGGKMAIGPV